MSVKTKGDVLTKGGMIPRYWGNPGPTGGWGRGKTGLPAGGILGGPWDWEFGVGTPAAPSITRLPPLPPSTAPSPDRVGAIARPPPSRQLVTSADIEHKSIQFSKLMSWGWDHLLDVMSGFRVVRFLYKIYYQLIISIRFKIFHTNWNTCFK